MSGMPQSQRTLAFNVTFFYDFDRRRGVNHIGKHEKVIERVVSNQKFFEWWRNVIADIIQAAGEVKSHPVRRPAISIATICNKGRRRSVATAEIIAYTLRQCGARRVFLDHAMKDMWCLGTCNGCDECLANTEAKVSTLRQVVREAMDNGLKV